MKRLSGAWAFGLRDMQAWFILGMMSGGYALSVLLLSLDRPRGAAADLRPSPVSGFIGCFFLAFAVPYAVIRLVELERDGRLDQVRLTGIAPLDLLRTIGGSSALPFAIAGLGFLLYAGWIGALNDGWWRLAIPLVGACVAISFLVMALPISRHHSDLRIVTAGAGVFIAGFSGIALDMDGGLWNLAFRYHVPVNAIAVGLVLIEAAVIAFALTRVSAAIARPRHSQDQATRSPARWTALVPRSLSRGVAAGAMPALSLATFGVALLVFRGIVGPSVPGVMTATLSLLPLLVGAVAVSTAAKSDAASSMLDVLRLSGAGALRSASRLIAGLWLPYLIAGAVIIGAGALLGSVPIALLVPLALGIVMVMPFSIMEGWHGAFLLTYTLPVALIAFRWSPNGNVVPPSLVAVFLAVCWIGWAAAASYMRAGVGSALSLRLRAAALTCVTIAALYPSPAYRVYAGIASVMIVTAGWFSDDRRPLRAHWPLPLIVFATLFGVHFYWRYSIEHSFEAGVLPAAALMTGLLLHRRFAHPVLPWSLAARVAAAVLINTADETGYFYASDLLSGGRLRDPSFAFQVIRLMTAVDLAVLAGIAIAAEAITFARSRFRRSAAIPRP